MDVTVIREGVDDYGDPIEGGASHVERDVEWWPFIPKQPSTHENTTGSDLYTSTETVRQFSFEPGADVRGEDTLVPPDGSRWHVIGDAFNWENPMTDTAAGLLVQAVLRS